jgi:hypothetical protein
MSPTDHPAEPGGALHAFFADRLPNTPPVAAAAAARLRGAHETAPLAAAPHVDVGLAGAAVDHLLRFAIAARPCPPGSSCHRGAGRLGCGAAAMRAVDEGLERVGLLAPYRRDVSDDEWLELTQISLLLATFERVDRTGLAAASLRNPARIPAGWREWAQLVCVEEDVEDVAVLGWAAAVDHRDLRGQRLTCNPRFAQTSMLGVGGADLLTDRGLLLGFTSTSSRGVCSGKDLWRLCSDVLAAAHDEHAIAGVGISALRWRTRATWQVDELFEQLAGKPVAIDDLRREFAQLLE